MEFERNQLIAAAVAAIVIIALAAYYGGLIGAGSPPDLALAAAVSPPTPYAGDVVEFSVLVTNAGGSRVSDAVVGLSLDGQQVMTKSVTLEPGASENITMRWLASEGTHEVRIMADSGNVIQESDEGNNAFSATVGVLPAEGPAPFSHLPDTGIVRAYYFNAARGGMNQLIGIFASGDEANRAFYSGLVSKLYDGRLGILNYANGSESAMMYLGAELSDEEFILGVGTMLGGDFTPSRQQAAGRSVSFFSESGGNVTTVCAWHEKGWNRILMYKQSMPEITIFNNTIGERTTCLDLVAAQYNASKAKEFMLPVEPLAAQVHLNDSTLLEALARSGDELLYARGFEDGNSAFLLLVSSSTAVLPERCLGTVLNDTGDKSICRLDRAALMGRVEMKAFERKQGTFTIMTFIAPFSGTSPGLADLKALNVTSGVVFPGVPEYNWSSQQQVQLSQCRFPSAFWCSNFSYANGTLSLGLTQLTGNEIRLNGFKCTQEESTPNGLFALPAPLLMGANETIEMSQPCYMDANSTYGGSVLYLRAHLYLNYTDLASNETHLVDGSLLVNNMGGGIRSPGQGG